jgi:predicted SprT family Zn-dependent metalloprotease
MKIPKEFELIDDKIKIKLDKLLIDKKNHIGFANYQENKIELDDSVYWKHFQEQSFLHELVHWILYKMGSDLEKDEKFVSLFASLLNQAFKTMKY